jgi:hypothetical protein
MSSLSKTYLTNLPDVLYENCLFPYLTPRQIFRSKLICKKFSTIKMNWMRYMTNLMAFNSSNKESYYERSSTLILFVDVYKDIIYMESMNVLNFALNNTLLSKYPQRIIQELQEKWIRDAVILNSFESLTILAEQCETLYICNIPKEYIFRTSVRYKNANLINKIIDAKIYDPLISEFSIIQKVCFNGKQTYTYVIDCELRDLFLIKLKSCLDERQMPKNNYVRTWNLVLKNKDYQTAKMLVDCKLMPPKDKYGRIQERFRFNLQIAKICGYYKHHLDFKTIKEEIYIEKCCKKCKYKYNHDNIGYYKDEKYQIQTLDYFIKNIVCKKCSLKYDRIKIVE